MANHNLSDVGELNEFDTMGATIGQVRIDLCRSASGQRIVAAIVLAGLLLLTACGGPAPAATSTATTTQAITPTATATPTTVLPPTVTVPPSTATPLPPTATVLPPTATLPPPTATIVAPTATSAAPAYMADFATWFSGSESAPFPFRAGFDPASGEYRLALTDARRGYVYFRSAPDERTFGDFRLDIDARRVAGPDNGVYGVVFRIQPPVAGATTFERYNFTVTPEGFYSLNLIKTDGTATIVAPRTASPAINKGDGVNQLTVIARGTQLTLAINGQTIGTFSGPVIGPGGVGVYVGNPPNSTAPAGMEAGFSNLRIATAP
jgi:hypothetical protein